MIRYERELTGVDWAEAAEVFRMAPLGKRDPDRLEQMFKNSYAYIIAWDDDKVIGLARALSDGIAHAAIYDVVLLPDYQGKGIGKRIMDELCAQLAVPSIILFAVPGREGFYKKCGFSMMTTAMARLNWGGDVVALGYIRPDKA